VGRGGGPCRREGDRGHLLVGPTSPPTQQVPNEAHRWTNVIERVESPGYSFKNKISLFLKLCKNHYT
jgi:hypothetical protein